MTDASDVVSQMTSALAISEPTLDTSIGTPVRKILDAVSEVVAEAYDDSLMLSYRYDVDAKSGDDLDSFVLMFGFTRLPANRATGMVDFTLPDASTTNVFIPAGTQVATSDGTAQFFSTVVPSMINVGQVTVSVPVSAVNGGSAGNIVAGAITLLATPVSASVTVSNSSAFTGGTDIESDDDLRARFKATIFRNLVGTDSMFQGVALEAGQQSTDATSQVTKVNVVGASQRWREQVQVDSSGNAISMIPATNAKYVFQGTQFFGPDISGGDLLTPGVQYTFGATVPPTVSSVAGALVPGTVYDLDFEYVSSASRNDPNNGITNRVDIWANGVRAVQAIENTYWRTITQFSATTTSPYYNTNFVRLGTTTAPSVNNYFLPLSFGPVLDVPQTLLINGVTYTLGTDYWIVHDDTVTGYTPKSLFGLEWLSTHIPPNNTAFTIVYDYNAIPTDIEDGVRRWRMTTQDVRAHAAKVVLLRVSLAVMYSPGVSQTVVNSAIQEALATFISSAGFDAVLQASDLVEVAHAVPGVDNVRLMTSYENGQNLAEFGIQRVDQNGNTITNYATPLSGGAPIPGTPARATDVVLGDNQIPALYAVGITAKAQNTWGVL